MSLIGRYCCKSPKSPGDNFPAIRRSDRRPPICVVSITLPRSPVSLSSGDEVPHITRKSRLQPGEFLITSAKRLLQQYRHESDLARCRPTLIGGVNSTSSLPGLTRQSIFLEKNLAKKLFRRRMDHPKSGLLDFGRLKYASRINPTCVVKPAGDGRGRSGLVGGHRRDPADVSTRGKGAA
jgi:hypothetical protein